MMSRQPLLSWALAAQAIAHKLDVLPLPPGVHEAEVGRWRLIVNNSKLEALHMQGDKPPLELPPFEVYLEHLEYLVFGLLGPAAGMIGGGYTEDAFVDDMVAFLPPSAVALFDDQLAQRKGSNT